jgi:very-short-patch-repair endonuclease
VSELKAEYVSDDVRRLNPDVFADDSEALSAAVSGAAADAPTPEERFIILWEMLTRIPLQREYVFYPGRRWRFDFAHVATRIAVEVNGGVWISGRHNRGQGYINDCEKMFHAAELGWRVFPLTPEQITVDNVQTIARTIQTGGSW